MQTFKLPKAVFEGALALEIVTPPPKKPAIARKSPYPVEDGIVLVTTDVFSADFEKILRFCRAHDHATISISDPLRPEFTARFILGGKLDTDTPQAQRKSLRDRGVAAVLGTQSRVAIVSTNFCGYLQLEGHVPPELKGHTEFPDREDTQLIRQFGSFLPPPPPLQSGQVYGRDINSLHKLYDHLRALEKSADSIAVFQIVGNENLPAFKLWRPDADIAVKGEIKLSKLQDICFHNEPALMQVNFGPGHRHTLSAIVTAPDYELRSDLAVVTEPFRHKALEGTLPLSFLSATSDVTKLVAEFKTVNDNLTITLDHEPVARLYGPQAPIKTVAAMSLYEIAGLATARSLAAVFKKAGGPVRIMPEGYENYAARQVDASFNPEPVGILTAYSRLHI